MTCILFRLSVENHIYWAYRCPAHCIQLMCQVMKMTQFTGAQFNFSIQQPPVLKVMQIERVAGEIQAASLVLNTNQFDIEMPHPLCVSLPSPSSSWGSSSITPHLAHPYSLLTCTGVSNWLWLQLIFHATELSSYYAVKSIAHFPQAPNSHF